MQILLYLVVIALADIIGKLCKKIGVPAILGWLLTGIFLGPNVLNLLNDGIMSSNWYTVLMPAVQLVVGMLIGANLDFDKIKENGKEIMALSFSEIGMTFLFVFLSFAVLFYFLNIPIIVAVVIGVIASATAPAPALSVPAEYNAKGSLTDTLTSVVVMNTIISNVLFFTLTSLLRSFYTDVSDSIFTTLSFTLFVPTLYGAGASFLVKQLLVNRKTVSSRAKTFVAASLLVIIGAYVIDQFLYPEPMMNTLIVGIAFMGTFVNLITPQVKQDVYTLFGDIQSFALLLLIVNLGAPLNPSTLVVAGLFAVIYIIARFAGKWWGTFSVAKTMGMDENIQKYLGITLTPHAGISLIFTAEAVSVLAAIAPQYAEIIQIIVPAAAVLNEIIALLLSKKAFEWAGEIGGARQSI